MKATVELISKLVESAYAGAVEGVDLATAKNDAVAAVFGGTVSTHAQPAAKDPLWAAHERKLRDALVHATDEELAALEAKLTAAETATHRNGEIHAVEEAVANIERRRW